jgi:hypothetical protein
MIQTLRASLEPISCKVARKRRVTEIDFALKSEIDHLIHRLCSLPNDLGHPKVQRWLTKKIKQKIERNEVRKLTLTLRRINEQAGRT